MESSDDFIRSLINQYDIFNPEFEDNLMSMLFVDFKVDLIAYALRKGFVLTDKIKEQIFDSGSIELHEYLKEKEIGFSSDLIIRNIQLDHLSMIPWLLANGCPPPTQFYVFVDALFQHPRSVEVAKLFFSEEQKIKMESFYSIYFANHASLDLLIWTYEKGIFSLDGEHVRTLIARNDISILDWLDSTDPRTHIIIGSFAYVERNINAMEWYRNKYHVMPQDVIQILESWLNDYP